MINPANICLGGPAWLLGSLCFEGCCLGQSFPHLGCLAQWLRPWPWKAPEARSRCLHSQLAIGARLWLAQRCSRDQRACQPGGVLHPAPRGGRTAQGPSRPRNVWPAPAAPCAGRAKPPAISPKDTAGSTNISSDCMACPNIKSHGLLKQQYRNHSLLDFPLSISTYTSAEAH